LGAIEGKNPPVSPFAKGGVRGIEKKGQLEAIGEIKKRV